MDLFISIGTELKLRSEVKKWATWCDTQFSKLPTLRRFLFLPGSPFTHYLSHLVWMNILHIDLIVPLGLIKVSSNSL